MQAQPKLLQRTLANLNENLELLRHFSRAEIDTLNNKHRHDEAKRNKEKTPFQFDTKCC